MKRKKYLSLILIASLIFGLCPGTMAFAAGSEKPAEIIIENPHKGTGYLPVDYTPEKTWHPEGAQGNADTESYEPLPSYYFPEDELTPVLDQGDHGYCWAYSLASTMEQSVIKRLGKKLEGDDLFYPEAFVSAVNNFRVDPLGLTQGDGITYLLKNEGYNLYCIAFLAMKGFGPIDLKKRKTVSQDEDLDYLDRAYRTKDVRFILFSDIDEVKRAIMKYGAVSINIDSDTLKLKAASENGNLTISNNHFVYVPFEFFSPDHIVTLVGWDDDIEASNFDYSEDRPCPVNGGFIIKNSWGTSVSYDGEAADKIRKKLGVSENGEPYIYEEPYNGYYFLSYADSSIWNNDEVVAYDMREAALDENLYYYDGGEGTECTNCYKAATRFTAQANKGKGEKVTGAIFGVDSPGEYCVDLYLYSDEDAADVEARPWYQECVATAHHIIAENSGIYTVEFDEPFTVNDGESFAVVLHREDDKGFSIFTDETVSYKWVAFTNHTEQGESYMVDENEEDLSQYDIQGITPRINAITENTDKVERSYEITEPKGTIVIEGDVCHVKMENIDPANITTKSKAGTYNAATGLLTAVKKGTIKLLHPVAKNGKTKEKPFCTVKVVSPKLKATQKVKAGKSKKLKLSGIKNPEVLWESTDTQVVTVDPKTGEIKGIAAGTAIVTATVKGYPRKHIYITEVTVK